jgi:parallel beta-helix repeat protein
MSRKEVIMKWLTRLLVCVGVLMAALVAVGAASATSGTLVVETDTTLTADHSGNIWIAADSVTLNCAGHSVDGSVTQIGIAAFARTGVTIRNCNVRGFAHGISLSAVDGFSLIGNTTSGNEGAGISLSVATHGLLAGNVARENGWGIGLQYVRNVEIARNRATGNGHDGVKVHTPWQGTHYSTGIRFLDNVSWGNGWAGFNLGELADGNTLAGNLAFSNKGHGFVVGSSYNTLERNIAIANGSTGFIAANRLNLLLPPQAELAFGNVFRWNMAVANGIFDAVDFTPAGSNSWSSNVFVKSYGI